MPRSKHQTKKRKQIQKNPSPLDHGLNCPVQVERISQNTTHLVELFEKWMKRLTIMLACLGGLGIVMTVQQFTFFFLLKNY